MTYSDAEKRVAAEQYSEAVKARWSERGNAIDAFPSVGVDLQCLVNRQQREIEEARQSMNDYRKWMEDRGNAYTRCTSEQWFARNTEAK